MSSASGSNGGNDVAAAMGSRRTGVEDVYHPTTIQAIQAPAFNPRANAGVAECLTAAYAAGVPLGVCK